MNILFKYPTRSRPERMFAVLDNILSKISDRSNYTILISADLDDSITYSIRVMEKLKMYLREHNVRFILGKSTSKVNAINRDIETVKDWDILVLITDFVEFTANGFDNIIRNNVNDYISINYPYPTEKPEFVLNFVNQFDENSITVPVVSREWLKSNSGELFNAEVDSKFGDELLRHRAKQFGCYELCEEQIFIHKHARNLYGQPDVQMLMNLQAWRKDLMTVESLQK